MICYRSTCSSTSELELLSSIANKSNGTMKTFLAVFVGCVLGFLVGISFPVPSLYKYKADIKFLSVQRKAEVSSSLIDENDSSLSGTVTKTSNNCQMRTTSLKICEPSNPRGAERLPPLIVANESDFYLRRLWGDPNDDLQSKPRYLVTFTVGYKQKNNIDAAVKKFSGNFTILLFHYDGRTSEWDEFEWSKQAIHVSVPRQAKWWYAKRFLHPDIVAAYDYIFIWDEDLGVEHFDGEEYIKLVKKHGLEISQPALEPNRGLTWRMTKKRNNCEVHKATKENSGRCPDPLKPPCAAFVEIMAPVFSRDSWRCVWHMLQNDLVHGWGLDFSLQRCVEPAHEKIGVVDAQWVVHQAIPSLGNQGQAQNGRAPWQGVRERCYREWAIFDKRMKHAEEDYFKRQQNSSC